MEAHATEIAAIAGKLKWHRASRHLHGHVPCGQQAEMPSRAGDRRRTRSRRRGCPLATLENPSGQPAFAQNGGPLKVYPCRAGVAAAALARVPVLVGRREGDPRERGVQVWLSQCLDAQKLGRVK